MLTNSPKTFKYDKNGQHIGLKYVCLKNQRCTPKWLKLQVSKTVEQSLRISLRYQVADKIFVLFAFLKYQTAFDHFVRPF